jgi:hypothetical protein
MEFSGRGGAFAPEIELYGQCEQVDADYNIYHIIIQFRLSGRL